MKDKVKGFENGKFDSLVKDIYETFQKKKAISCSTDGKYILVEGKHWFGSNYRRSRSLIKIFPVDISKNSFSEETSRPNISTFYFNDNVIYIPSYYMSCLHQFIFENNTTGYNYSKKPEIGNLISDFVKVPLCSLVNFANEYNLEKFLKKLPVHLIRRKNSTENSFQSYVIPIYIRDARDIYILPISLYNTIFVIFKCPLCDKEINVRITEDFIKENQSKLFTLNDVKHNCTNRNVKSGYVVYEFVGFYIKSLFRERPKKEKTLVIEDFFITPSQFAIPFFKEYFCNEKDTLLSRAYFSEYNNYDVSITKSYQLLSVVSPTLKIIVNDLLYERLISSKNFLAFLVSSKNSFMK